MPNTDYDEVLSIFLNGQMKVYSQMKCSKMIDEKLDTDYNQFCEVVVEVFKEDPPTFSLDKVFKKIPTNKWLQICLNSAQP